MREIATTGFHWKEKRSLSFNYSQFVYHYWKAALNWWVLNFQAHIGWIFGRGSFPAPSSKSRRGKFYFHELQRGEIPVLLPAGAKRKKVNPIIRADGYLSFPLKFPTETTFKQIMLRMLSPRPSPVPCVSRSCRKLMLCKIVTFTMQETCGTLS